jgi:hypothetical protein
MKCSVSSPALPSLDRLDKLLQDQLHATVSATMGVGSTCRASKKTEVAVLKASYNFSHFFLKTLTSKKLLLQFSWNSLYFKGN